MWPPEAARGAWDRVSFGAPGAAQPATPSFGLPAYKRWGAVCCLQPRSLGNVPVFQQPWKQTPTVPETVTGAPQHGSDSTLTTQTA